MSRCIEYGKCEVCGKEATLQRTYWHYDIKCECCSPKHFEFKRHCSDCVPVEPKYTKVQLQTENLKIDDYKKINIINICNSEYKVLIHKLHNKIINLKTLNKKEIETILTKYLDIELGTIINPFLIKDK